MNSKQVDADELLTRFCQWQHELNDHNPTSRGHWDVAVLASVHKVSPAMFNPPNQANS